MYFTTTLLLALQAVSIPVLAAPHKHEAKHAFSIKTHRARKDFHHEYKKVLGKHNLTGPAELHHHRHRPTKTHDKRQSVVATMAANPVQYIVPVTIGNQSFHLDFDTGSADLWVYNASMASTYTTGHHTYNSSLSKTYAKMPSGTFNLTYFDGSFARGAVNYDTVVVGPVTVTKQAVEVATQVSASFYTDKQHDGLLGLALSVTNKVRPSYQKTWMENALPQFKYPLFSANLKNGVGAIGSYDFGFMNSSSYLGKIQNASVITSTYQWAISSQFYAVGGTNYTESGAVAVIDTGSSIMLMSPTAVKNYYAKISGGGYNPTYGAYTFPCTSTPPPITLSVGIYNATIPSAYLVYGKFSATVCAGAIQSSGRPGYYIYGDPFFKTFYTVFNYAGLSFPFFKATIGFAPHSN